MDAKYLEEIKEKLVEADIVDDWDEVNSDLVYQDIPTLLAEVERLQNMGTRVHAHWNKGNYYERDGYDYSCVTGYECSNCGYEIDYKHPNYCPRCGAEMEQRDD
ncbi:MAG: hypothetical protein PHX08_26740 [Lachnospiraceae bacterium]|nr:hypothetical protein [Lachnospiraceae bacterium]